jgi:hypothetical protein
VVGVDVKVGIPGVMVRVGVLVGTVGVDVGVMDGTPSVIVALGVRVGIGVAVYVGVAVGTVGVGVRVGPPGVTLAVGVRVGVAVGTVDPMMTSRHHSCNTPVSPPTASLAVMVHVPAVVPPSKTERGLFGVYRPLEA